MKEQFVIKSYKNYCPICLHFQTSGSFCEEIGQNIGLYPKKFVEKCNGEYYEYDPHKTEAYKQLHENINNMNDTELVEMMERSNEYPKELLSITTSEAKKRGGLEQIKIKIEKNHQEELRAKEEKRREEAAKLRQKLSEERDRSGKGHSTGIGLCPFSWIEVTKPAGCLSSIFGGKERLVTEPQPCMTAHCQLWDSSQSNCGLITKRQ